MKLLAKILTFIVAMLMPSILFLFSFFASCGVGIFLCQHRICDAIAVGLAGAGGWIACMWATRYSIDGWRDFWARKA